MTAPAGGRRSRRAASRARLSRIIPAVADIVPVAAHCLFALGSVFFGVAAIIRARGRGRAEVIRAWLQGLADLERARRGEPGSRLGTDAKQ